MVYYGVAQIIGHISFSDAASILSADFKHVSIKSIDSVIIKFGGKLNSHKKDIISIVEFSHVDDDKGGDEEKSSSLSFL